MRCCLRCQHHRTGHAVANVVVHALRMIDSVAPPTRDSTLQRAKLCDQPLVVEQFDPPAVQERQQGAIQVAFGFYRDDIFDAMHPKAFARPFTSKTIAINAADAIALQCGSKFRDHAVWRKWRSALSETIDG